MAGPHQPSGLPDADLPHQKYMYVCMYVCITYFALHRDSSSTFAQGKAEGSAPSFKKCTQFKIT